MPLPLLLLLLVPLPLLVLLLLLLPLLVLLLLLGLLPLRVLLLLLGLLVLLLLLVLLPLLLLVLLPLLLLALLPLLLLLLLLVLLLVLLLGPPLLLGRVLVFVLLPVSISGSDVVSSNSPSIRRAGAASGSPAGSSAGHSLPRIACASVSSRQSSSSCIAALATTAPVIQNHAHAFIVRVSFGRLFTRGPI